MTVFLAFNVPVLAEVDLETGRVVSVQVNDEAAGEPTEVFSVEQAVSDSERERAIQVAEREVWPAWELGP